MPKILINEIDQTTPGTPAGYANYSVLIAGFDGEGDHATVKPDDNGVYEFSSYQDFVDAIGVVEPDIDKENISVFTVTHSVENMGTQYTTAAAAT